MNSLIIKPIPIDGRLPRPCDYEVCELDATVFVTAPGIAGQDGDEYKDTPLCTGHAHVVIAEFMVGR